MRVCFLTMVLAMAMAMPTRKAIPPTPRHTGSHGDPASMKDIANRLSASSPKEEEAPWEMSGRFQGDIMLDEFPLRNVILNETQHWPGGVLPYYIVEEDFTNEEVDTIQNALKVFRVVPCLKFRAYRKGDEDFVEIRGNGTGCWSFLGRKSGGQVLNLQTQSKCLRPGTIQHEFLHALGLHHQQSASDRDDYVKINWENIKEGKENNFIKYNTSVVTDHGVGYDYDSILHYSSKAFSKNGKPTIEPLDKDAVIGQREKLSEKDIHKLEHTYNCKKDYDTV